MFPNICGYLFLGLETIDPRLLSVKPGLGACDPKHAKFPSEEFRVFRISCHSPYLKEKRDGAF
jgi:hypothetical protein